MNFESLKELCMVLWNCTPLLLLFFAVFILGMPIVGAVFDVMDDISKGGNL